MSISNFKKESLSKGLSLFIESFRDFIMNRLTATEGERWGEYYYQKLSPAQQQTWGRGREAGSSERNLVDFGNLAAFARSEKEFFRPFFKRDINNLVTWFNEIADVRNATAHFSEVPEDKALKAWINLKAIAEAIGDTDLVAGLQKLRDAQPDAPPATAMPVGLHPWFRLTTPHTDVKGGHLDESVFAANLAEVVGGSGPAVYNNRETFFAKTYATQGLKTIARRVIGGLNGTEESDNRVISLQTGFGGGKTHTLISLYHLSKWGRAAGDSSSMAELIAATGVPKFDAANVAVFTNNTNDVVNGRVTPDGTHLQTLWGELAWQLGGAAAYEIVRKNDEARVAPAGLFKKVLEQCRPALILIDELADYCVKASGIKVGKSSLADQTISFMQELTEAVAGTPQCVVVITLPASAGEVGSEQIAADILASLEKRVSRVGADTQPVADDEVYEVIRRRLFDEIGDVHSIEAAIAEYARTYKNLKSELPAHVQKAEYRQKMLKAYPFHPELIDVFRVRWASNHGFQRTRGVLRLLAAIVSDLWKRRDSLPGGNLLIHPSDVNVGAIDALGGQLTKLYGSGWDAVITADVSGSSSNAFRIDSDKKDYGDWALTKGIASLLVMNSFGSDGANKGLSIADLKLQVVRPNGFNHHFVNGALNALEGTAYYLYYSTTNPRRYWFHTKPNINILINSTTADIKDMDVEAEVVDRLKKQTKGLALFGNAIVAPDGDSPEQQKPTLVILSPTYCAGLDTISPKTKTLVEQLAQYRGAGNRHYRNTLLFLVCSELGWGKLKTTVGMYLACKKIGEDYNSQLDREQQTEIKRKTEESSRAIDTTLIEAYSIVLRYSAKKGVQVLLLKDFSAGSLAEQLGKTLPEALREEEWMIDTVGLLTLRKHDLLPIPGRPQSVKEAYEAFLRFDDKEMIEDAGSLQNKLVTYCQNGEFGIAAGDGKMFKRYYFKEAVPGFDVQDETFYLVHPDDIPQPAPVPEAPAAGTAAMGGLDAPAPSVNEGSILAAGTDTLKKVKSITVSGRVGLSDYTQLFNSFVQPMRNNDVEIEIVIKSRSTPGHPLTELSEGYKIAKESAKQLGLDFKEETV